MTSQSGTITITITITITHDEALVLSDLAHRAVHDSSLYETSRAEWVVFSALLGPLEETLVEPFDPRYGELVAAARARLARLHGDT